MWTKVSQYDSESCLFQLLSSCFIILFYCSDRKWLESKETMKKSWKPELKHGVWIHGVPVRPSGHEDATASPAAANRSSQLLNPVFFIYLAAGRTVGMAWQKGLLCHFYWCLVIILSLWTKRAFMAHIKKKKSDFYRNQTSTIKSR